MFRREKEIEEEAKDMEDNLDPTKEKYYSDKSQNRELNNKISNINTYKLKSLAKTKLNKNFKWLEILWKFHFILNFIDKFKNYKNQMKNKSLSLK